MTVPAGVEADFVSPRARGEYVAISAALFLAWFAWSTQAMLAVVLAQEGFAPAMAGLIIGIGIIPSQIATLTAGRLMARTRPLAIAIAGFALMLAGHVALEWVRDMWVPLFAARLVQGTGQGLGVTAMMVACQRRLTDRRMVYFFGMFTSMLSLPNVIGPPVAELYLNRIGTEGLFLATGAPILVAIALLLRPVAHETPPPARAASGPGYLALVTHPGTRLVHLLTVAAGFLWGFVPAFLALLLLQRGLPAWSFFSVMTVTLFGARFGLLAGVHALPRHVVVAGGMALYGLAYLLLWATPSLWATIAAAIAFGLGHSTAFPILSVWSSMRFPSAERGRAVALAQLLFSGGSGMAPLAGGALIQLFGLSNLLAAMGVVPLALGGLILLRQRGGN